MLGSAQILIVDDNAGVRRVTRRVLEGHGLNVLEAVDGRTALSLVERFRPDLVLLDLMLPDTDGFRLLKELRRRQGD
jgi:CheY-like chemotaxis protein